MFSSEHAIWKFAWAGDELDDWLPYAEDLTKKWSAQNADEIKFGGTFEIILASLLLEDDLLPASARVAFAKLMLEVVNETTTNKYRLQCLYITPPKPGRKKTPNRNIFVLKEVISLLKSGATASQAYEVVAAKLFKSPDTIRRIYERWVKKKSQREKQGEIKS